MLSRTLSAVIVAGLLTASPGLAWGQGADTPFERVVAERAASIVTLKFILKAEGEEQEDEATGVMIDAKGLVLASNVSFGGLASRFGGPAVTPTDIKVLIGDDTQGVAAKIIARDSDLNLAWLQIDAPAAEPYSFVDFAKAGTAKLGDQIFSLIRLGKFFDRQPMMAEGKVASVTAKPRKLLIPSMTLAGADFGLPVFDDAGRPVGVVTLILPEQEEVEGVPGGIPQILKGVSGSKMILPADEVVAATRRAKETAASGGGEPAPAAPATRKPDAPAPPK